MSVDSPPQSVPRISANKCPCPRNWNLTFIGWMYLKRNNEMTQSNHKFKGKSVWNSFNPVAVNLTFNGRNRGSSFSFCFLLKKTKNKKKKPTEHSQVDQSFSILFNKSMIWKITISRPLILQLKWIENVIDFYRFEFSSPVKRRSTETLTRFYCTAVQRTISIFSVIFISHRTTFTDTFKNMAWKIPI